MRDWTSAVHCIGPVLCKYSYTCDIIDIDVVHRLLEISG